MRYLLAAFLLSLGACSLWNEPCPCGRSFERDPWRDDVALAMGPEHAVGVHCVCRCGGVGDRTLEDPSASCERYETECRLAGGELSAYVCE